MRLLLALAVVVTALPLCGATIAVLPLSNPGGADEAATVVETELATALGTRGWTPAPAGTTEAFLEEKRIRYLDSLSREHAAELTKRTAADAILLTSIVASRETANPMAAVSVRLLDAGGEAFWSELVTLTASETEGVLGLGRRDDPSSLARQVASRIASRLPRPGEAKRTRLEAGGFVRGPVTYRSAAHPRGTRRRVCVLPFPSPVPEATRVVAEILAVRLEATGEFDVVEPSEFRSAMRAAGFRSVPAMTSADLQKLSGHLGTTLFLRGNIHTWRDGTGMRSEIQLDMTLADVATGEIVWAVTHQRRGSDYAGLFQRGAVDSVVGLADRALSETIAEQHRARPQGPGRRGVKQARRER